MVWKSPSDGEVFQRENYGLKIKFSTPQISAALAWCNEFGPLKCMCIRTKDSLSSHTAFVAWRIEFCETKKINAREIHFISFWTSVKIRSLPRYQECVAEARYFYVTPWTGLITSILEIFWFLSKLVYLKILRKIHKKLIRRNEKRKITKGFKRCA